MQCVHACLCVYVCMCVCVCVCNGFVERGWGVGENVYTTCGSANRHPPVCVSQNLCLSLNMILYN